MLRLAGLVKLPAGAGSGEPRQRLIHGLQSRFSPLLARAIFHHERSEFFTTATPFFTVRREPNLLVKLPAVAGSSCRRDCGCSPQRDCALQAQRDSRWRMNEIAQLVLGSGEPRQRLIHGLQSRFSPLLVRAIFHHERSEFFTTATPFFTVRRQPNLSS